MWWFWGSRQISKVIFKFSWSSKQYLKSYLKSSLLTFLSCCCFLKSFLNLDLHWNDQICKWDNDVIHSSFGQQEHFSSWGLGSFHVVRVKAYLEDVFQQQNILKDFVWLSSLNETYRPWKYLCITTFYYAEFNVFVISMWFFLSTLPWTVHGVFPFLQFQVLSRPRVLNVIKWML